MEQIRLFLNIAAYLAAGYLITLALVWLVTRSEPELWIYRDWAMKPVEFLLAPFGIRFTPQNSRAGVRKAFQKDRDEEVTSPSGTSNRFKSVRAAKEHLIARIVAEAERDGVTLTDVERKMLYFSETGWTLPGILEVNAEFEREYDLDAYEQKVAGLVHAIEECSAGEEQEAWDDAVIKLSEGDHYLLVLIDEGERLQKPRSPILRQARLWLPRLDPRAKRDPLDVLRLFVVALAVIVSIVVYATLTSRR